MAVESLDLVPKKGNSSNWKFKMEEVDLCGINILKHTLDVKITRVVDADS